MSYGLLAVGLVYLAIGGWVWRLKPDRRESWALLLFCAITSALLVLVGPQHPPVATMIGLTIPWIGASAFHLFTTYPMEPHWAVRWPEVRVATWLGAAVLAGAELVAPRLGAAGPWIDAAVTFYASGLALLCVGLLMGERFRSRGHPAGARADVMLAGGFASYVPVVAFLLWHFIWGTSFPWSLSLLGFFVFPAAVAWGVLRRELFDVRLAAKSSAAYGAVTLGITGLFALTITFADALIGRFDVDATSPVFSVVLPVLRDPALQSAARARAGSGGSRLRPRPRGLPPRRPRDLRGDGLDALRARDRGPHPGRGERHDGRRALDGAAHGRRGGGAARRGCRAATGTRTAARFSLAPDHPIARALWMRRRGARARGFRRRAGSGAARGVPRRLRHARRRAARPDPVRRRSARRDRGRAQALGRAASARTSASCSARSPTRARSRSRTRAPSTRSRSSTRRSRRAWTSARASCATPRPSSSRARRCARSASSWRASRTSSTTRSASCTRTSSCSTSTSSACSSRGSTRRSAGRRRRPSPSCCSRSREGTERVKQIVQDLRTFSRTDQAELQQVQLERRDRPHARARSRAALKGDRRSCATTASCRRCAATRAS